MSSREGAGTAPRGYTLIEVSVVLIILAMAMAAVVPAVGRGVDTIRARAEVAGVVSFLRLAREQAVTQNRLQTVRVDERAELLVLASVDSGGTEAVKATRRLIGPVHVEANGPGGNAITFLPQGLSSGGRLRIKAVGQQVFLVTVDATTGRVAARRAE